MAKSASRRWRNWRVSEDGRTIRSNPKRDPDRKRNKRRKGNGGKKAKKARWYWIEAKYQGACRSCGSSVQQGERIAYSAKRKGILCSCCAQQSGVAANCRISNALRDKERADRQS